VLKGCCEVSQRVFPALEVAPLWIYLNDRRLEYPDVCQTQGLPTYRCRGRSPGPSFCQATADRIRKMSVCTVRRGTVIRARERSEFYCQERHLFRNSAKRLAYV